MGSGNRSSRHSFGLRKRLPVEGLVRFRELGHLDRLIDGDVAEDLRRSAGRPVDFQQRHPSGFGQADRLLQRARPEAASRRNVPVDRQRLLAGGDTLIRAPMAARLVFLPTSFTVSQWFPWPGF